MGCLIQVMKQLFVCEIKAHRVVGPFEPLPDHLECAFAGSSRCVSIPVIYVLGEDVIEASPQEAVGVVFARGFR